MTTALALPEAKYLEPIQRLAQRTAELRIVDQASFEEAGATRRDVKTVLDSIEADSKPISTKLNQAHKDFLALVKKSTDPLLQLDATLNEACKRYIVEERKRAEQVRAEAEAKLRREREEAEQIAREAAATGDAAMVELAKAEVRKIESAPAPTTAPVHASTMRIGDAWKYRVKNLKAFLQGVIDGVIPEDAVELTARVGQEVRKQKADFNWPGIEAYSEPSTGRR